MLIDVIALVLGIWMTIRKLDVRRREPEQFPTVSAEAFARWKATANRAYTLGSSASFGYLVGNYVFEWLGTRAGLPLPTMAAGHWVLFVAWIVAMIMTGVRARRAGRLQDELGIVLAPRAPAPGPEP